MIITRKGFSIFHILIALMLFSLVLPAGTVNAKVNGGDTSTEKGSLTIYKVEQEPGSEQGNADGSKLPSDPDGSPLEGVTFTLTQTHSYNPETDEWTAFSGTPTDYVTDGNGKIVINNIDLGRYKVQETAGPDHVNLNEEEYFVDIPMTSNDGTKVNYDVHIYPKNETIRGGAELIKFANNTEETLDGVKFNVFHENGEPVKDDDGNIITLTTVNGKVNIDGLAHGDYYFEEIESIDGYLLNGERVTFSISNSTDTVSVSLNNYSKPEVEKEVDKEFVNRGETVTYTIEVTLPEDIAEYDHFNVTDILDSRLEYVAGSEDSPGGFTFDQDDQTLTWTGNPSALEPGVATITFDAKVKEDATPNEPIPNEAEIDYNNKWTEDSEKTPPVTVTPTVGSLTVKKIDGDTEKALGGAEFELRDSDGHVVASGKSGANGIVDFNGGTDELDYGTYTLHETKAPNEYNLLRNPIDVEINEEDSEVELTVKNYKSGWELPKTGGMGTLLFTLIGMTLMGAALYMFIRRRKNTDTV